MNNINYKTGFVVFLDVLGFKNMVKLKQYDKINKYLDIVYSNINMLEKIDSKKDINYIVISDSIILSVDTVNSVNDNIKIFRNLCLSVALIQEALATEDIWLRGAISIGETYFDKKKNQIIGEGYIRAYELESSQAIYPRVIIDNKMINFLEQENASSLIKIINDNSVNNWNGNILYNWETRTNIITNATFSSYTFDKDIPLFIDYLDNKVKLYKNSLNVNNDEYINQEKHKNNLNSLIIKIKNSSYESTEIYKKYRWVANYLFSKFRNDPSNIKEKLLEI